MITKTDSVTKTQSVNKVRKIINEMHEHSPVNEQVFTQSLKHSLDYFDLLNATLSIEAKYKGEFYREQLFTEAIINPHAELWNEAYYCALHLKRQKMDKWKYHVPQLESLGVTEIRDKELEAEYECWAHSRNKKYEELLIRDRELHFDNCKYK